MACFVAMGRPNASRCLAVRDCLIECAFGQAQALCCDRYARGIQDLQCDPVSVADLAQQIRFGNSALVEHEFRRSTAAHSHLPVLFVDFEPRGVALDHDCGDAAVTFGAIGGDEHGEDIGDRCVGDEQLCAV